MTSKLGMSRNVWQNEKLLPLLFHVQVNKGPWVNVKLDFLLLTCEDKELQLPGILKKSNYDNINIYELQAAKGSLFQSWSLFWSSGGTYPFTKKKKIKSQLIGKAFQSWEETIQMSWQYYIFMSAVWCKAIRNLFV